MVMTPSQLDDDGGGGYSISEQPPPAEEAPDWDWHQDGQSDDSAINPEGQVDVDDQLDQRSDTSDGCETCARWRQWVDGQFQNTLRVPVRLLAKSNDANMTAGILLGKATEHARYADDPKTRGIRAAFPESQEEILMRMLAAAATALKHAAKKGNALTFLQAVDLCPRPVENLLYTTWFRLPRLSHFLGRILRYLSAINVLGAAHEVYDPHQSSGTVKDRRYETNEEGPAPIVLDEVLQNMPECHAKRRVHRGDTTDICVKIADMVCFLYPNQRVPATDACARNSAWDQHVQGLPEYKRERVVADNTIVHLLFRICAFAFSAFSFSFSTKKQLLMAVYTHSMRWLIESALGIGTATVGQMDTENEEDVTSLLSTLYWRRPETGLDLRELLSAALRRSQTLSHFTRMSMPEVAAAFVGLTVPQTVSVDDPVPTLA